MAIIPQWPMFIFGTLDTVCNGRGPSNPCQIKGHCLQLVDKVDKAGYRLANDGQWVSRHSLDSGSANDPLSRDAIDNTAGQWLSSLPASGFQGSATQAMVDRFFRGYSWMF